MRDSSSSILLSFAMRLQTWGRLWLWQPWMVLSNGSHSVTSLTWSHLHKRLPNSLRFAYTAPTRLLSRRGWLQASKCSWLVEQICTNLFAEAASSWRTPRSWKYRQMFRTLRSRQRLRRFLAENVFVIRLLSVFIPIFMIKWQRISLFSQSVSSLDIFTVEDKCHRISISLKIYCDINMNIEFQYKIVISQIVIK